MRRIESLIVVAIALLFATPSIAQKIQERPLQGNPYRDVGGSCVYGATGEVLYSPKGAVCKDRREDLDPSDMTPEARLASLPPALRNEAQSLLADHNHIAEELARLRRAIATEGKKRALVAADRVIEELTRHHAREEKFLLSLAPREE